MTLSEAKDAMLKGDVVNGHCGQIFALLAPGSMSLDDPKPPRYTQDLVVTEGWVAVVLDGDANEIDAVPLGELPIEDDEE